MRTARLLLCLSALLVWPGSARAFEAAVMILHIDGVTGDYPGLIDDSLYLGDISISQFSLGITRSPDEHGLPGATNFSDVAITKGLDSSGPTLALACAGQQLPGALAAIHVFRFNLGTPVEMETVTLLPVQVSSFKDIAVPGSVKQKLTLQFGSITVNYPSSQVRTGNAALYLPGIQSGFTDALHTNWLPLISFSVGVTNAPASPNSPQLQIPVFPDILIQHCSDPASSGLVQACQNGTVFNDVIIDSVALSPHGSAPVWYHLKLETAWISAYNQSWTTGDENIETFQLHPLGKITWSYTLAPSDPLNPDTFSAYYDQNKSGGDTNAAFATVTGVQATDSSTITLSWPAVEGASYLILKAPQIQGPFSPATNVVATSTGTMTAAFPRTGGFNFYRVQLPFISN